MKIFRKDTWEDRRINDRGNRWTERDTSTETCGKACEQSGTAEPFTITSVGTADGLIMRRVML